MENTDKFNGESMEIQGLLARFLNVRESGRAVATRTPHLDDDSLSAFVEGALSESEASPMISHLVDCSFCRHVTADLVRLDLAFSDEPLPVKLVSESEPASVSSVLSAIISRIFGTTDGAVFAHNEEKEEPDDRASDDKLSDDTR